MTCSKFKTGAKLFLFFFEYLWIFRPFFHDKDISENLGPVELVWRLLLSFSALSEQTCQNVLLFHGGKFIFFIFVLYMHACMYTVHLKSQIGIYYVAL